LFLLLHRTRHSRTIYKKTTSYEQNESNKDRLYIMKCAYEVVYLYSICIYM